MCIVKDSLLLVIMINFSFFEVQDFANTLLNFSDKPNY